VTPHQTHSQCCTKTWYRPAAVTPHHTRLTHNAVRKFDTAQLLWHHTRLTHNAVRKLDTAQLLWHHTTPDSLTMLYDTLLNTKLSHSSTAFLRNETVLRLVKKFSTSYGTGRLNIVPRWAGHWSITRIWKIQPTNSYVISLRYILILSSHLHRGFQSGLFPSSLSLKIQHLNAVHTNPLYMPIVCGLCILKTV